MDKGTQRLFPSLVGASTEFSFKKKLSSATPIEKNIQSAREKITRDVEEALEIGGELCVMLLAELTNYFRNETYYMAVRSAIEMRRYRPSVLDYLQLSVEERSDRLKTALSTKLRGDKTRDFKVTILRYFLRTYPSRTHEFKHLLTREEYFIVV